MRQRLLAVAVLAFCVTQCELMRSVRARCAARISSYCAVAVNLPHNNHSHNASFGNYARTILEAFPANSVILGIKTSSLQRKLTLSGPLAVNGDMELNSFKYAQECEGFRPDLRVIRSTSVRHATALHFLRAQLPTDHRTLVQCDASAALPWSRVSQTSLSDLRANSACLQISWFAGS